MLICTLSVHWSKAENIFKELYKFYSLQPQKSHEKNILFSVDATYIGKCFCHPIGDNLLLSKFLTFWF